MSAISIGGHGFLGQAKAAAQLLRPTTLSVLENLMQ